MSVNLGPWPSLYESRQKALDNNPGVGYELKQDSLGRWGWVMQTGTPYEAEIEEIKRRLSKLEGDV